MRKLTFACLLLFCMTTFAQSNFINYKALIKDSGGTTLASEDIDVRFTIIEDTGSNNVYQESHTNATTDANGIVILNIGNGNVITGVFNDIDWGSDTHSLKVEIDIEQDASFLDMGTTPFMWVPYAHHAKTAENVLNGAVDDGDWVVTSGADYTNGNDGNIGIGDINADQNRWQLTVKDTGNSMLDANTIDSSELFGVFSRNLNENNTGVGIGFLSTTSLGVMGAAIVHERTNNNSKGKLHFATKGDNLLNEDIPIRMTLSEDGRLGVGVTSPTEYLHISGGNGLFDRGSGDSGIRRLITMGGARSGNATYAALDFQNYDSDSGIEYVGASIRSNNSGDTMEKGNLRFQTYDGVLTERMRINESGLVGIGEPQPQARLDVADIAVIGNVLVGEESSDQGTSAASGLGFTTTPWLYTNAIEAQGERGTLSTLITLGADGTHGLTDEIHMVTSGNSQMTIASDGKVGLNKTSPLTDLHIRQSSTSPTSDNGGIRLEEGSDATDFWRIYHSGSYLSFNNKANRVAFVNTTGAWTVNSDRRLKYNIAPLQPVLDRVLQLKVVDYLYNEQKSTENKMIGFVAQEVKPLFPEIVVTSEENKLGITYGATGVIAIKAIQEQQVIIEEQNKKIEKLENELATIKEMLLKMNAKK